MPNQLGIQLFPTMVTAGPDGQILKLKPGFQGPDELQEMMQQTLAQITPPVGFNLFVLQTMSGRDINYVARASLPFFFMMLLALGIVIAFPALSTWLPDTVIGVTKR